MENVHARELLARERRRIEASLHHLRDGASEDLSHLHQHLAESASDLFESERDAGLLDRLERELSALTRAEQRLDAGRYGLSVESGLPIPDARLEIVPWAERTVEEQARAERRV